MSKAEERALEVFPLKIDGDSRGSYDLNVVKRIVYQQGYEQAEKDVLDVIEKELTRRMLEDYNTGAEEDEIAQGCMASFIMFVRRIKEG